MAKPTRTFPLTEKLRRFFTATAVASLVVIALGLVCFLTQRGQLRSIGVFVLCVGVVLCWGSVTFRHQAAQSHRRLASSDAPPSPPANAIAAFERLMTICKRWVLVGVAIAGAGVVCCFVLGSENRWIGAVLLTDGVVQVAAGLALRRRARRVRDRLHTLAADR